MTVPLRSSRRVFYRLRCKVKSRAAHIRESIFPSLIPPRMPPTPLQTSERRSKRPSKSFLVIRRRTLLSLPSGCSHLMNGSQRDGSRCLFKASVIHWPAHPFGLEFSANGINCARYYRVEVLVTSLSPLTAGTGMKYSIFGCNSCWSRICKDSTHPMRLLALLPPMAPVFSRLRLVQLQIHFWAPRTPRRLVARLANASRTHHRSSQFRRSKNHVVGMGQRKTSSRA